MDSTIEITEIVSIKKSLVCITRLHSVREEVLDTPGADISDMLNMFKHITALNIKERSRDAERI